MLFYGKEKTMKTTSIEHQTEEDPNELNEIIAKIVEVIEVERIYLNKGVSHQSFINRLNIITKVSQKDNVEDIRPVLDSIFLNNENFSYQVFPFSYANLELQQGNLYFVNNCHKNNLVYKTLQDTLIWNYPSQDSNKLVEKIKQDFKRDMSRVKSFKKGICYFRTQNHLSQSAFMMHQAFEQGYRILEKFICGRIKICHSIKNHQNYVLKSVHKLESIFLVESDAETRMLDVLEDAYSSARYSHNYKITEKELDQLSQKLGLFIKDIQFLFNEELSVFKAIKIHDDMDSYSEQTIEASSKTNKTAYLVRQLEFENAYEMLCIAKSLMVLSVTCLQDDITPPISIYGFQYEINEVLQLAIKLLPLEETSP
ncbi:hypothetical protein APS56_04705 [Pseudalgibacter alginicilyticus]|uniref:HEPN domain-containing protein n=2 Tax=Pseudalgibacter alginicilyticus TaxID=1736674 RepID=A0A0P0D3E9_9FLAO|nr:hypothetical protein APS56_04705 [Pseudalgibacter alginicilyticus]